MTGSRRVIDANANRAREALRVMEDAARFLLDDTHLCSVLKGIRHDLAGVIADLPGPGAELAARNTSGDVGTGIEVAGEFTRSGSRDVVVAAGKRLTEALRCIEEFMKTLEAPGLARRVEQLRYRVYDAERGLTLAMGTGRAKQWRLCVLLTESLCVHHNWESVAEKAIEGGADCLQLREKTLDGAELERRAESLLRIARPNGVPVVVNDRVDVALSSGADGVHLGQSDLSVEGARKIAGFDLLIGVSTSCIEEARKALHAGADYCGVGAMFSTTTKYKESISGTDYLREYIAHDPPLPPHLAIGGVTPENASALVSCGARGLAVSSYVCASADPQRVCAELTEATRGVRLADGQGE